MDGKNAFDDKNSLFFAIKLTLWLCAGFAVVVLACFILSKGWDEAAKWGAFGDFVGGLLNPFFTFANLVLLVTISYQLKLREEAQAAADREAEDKRAKVELVYGLRHEAFKELIKILNGVPAPFENNMGYSATVSKASRDFAEQYENNSHLFPGTNDAYNAIKNSLNRLLSVALPYDNTFGQPERYQFRQRLHSDLIESYTTDFAFVKPAFVDLLRSSMRE